MKRSVSTALAVAAHDEAPRTLVDAAYRRLRDDIIGGRFGAGEKLRVEHLRAEYDLGATPLREALSRLSAESLVQSIGQRGFRVAPMSLAELEDITEARVLLETRCLEEAIERGDVEWEGRVASAHHMLSRIDTKLRSRNPPSPAEREKRNAEFHEALVSACGSPWLLKLREVLYDQHCRYRHLAVHEMPSAKRDLAREHQLVFDAVMARSKKKAVALLADHIRQTALQLRALLEDRLS